MELNGVLTMAKDMLKNKGRGRGGGGGHVQLQVVVERRRGLDENSTKLNRDVHRIWLR
jgi:hypothetical protein